MFSIINHLSFRFDCIIFSVYNSGTKNNLGFTFFCFLCFLCFYYKKPAVPYSGHCNIAFIIVIVLTIYDYYLHLTNRSKIAYTARCAFLWYLLYFPKQIAHRAIFGETGVSTGIRTQKTCSPDYQSCVVLFRQQ